MFSFRVCVVLQHTRACINCFTDIHFFIIKNWDNICIIIK